MSFCPLHKTLKSWFTYPEECPICEHEGMKVVICELDKKSRIEDSLKEYGYELDWSASHYFLVFRKKIK